MLPKRLRSLVGSLAVRLTLWYGAVFSLTLVIAVLFLYLLVNTVMRQQTDSDLAKQSQTVGSLLKIEGIEGVGRFALLESQAAGLKKVFFRLLYPNGTVFSSSNMAYWKDIKVRQEALQKLVAGQDQVFETIRIGEKQQQVRVLYAVIRPGLLLQLGQSMENQSRFVHVFQRMVVTTMILLTGLALVLGWFMARKATAGLKVVTHTAHKIALGDLTPRVPIPRNKETDDEIDVLGRTFNSMLDRIQQLVSGIRQMGDNIAHDLKSPITRIRGQAEVTLTTATRIADYEIMAGSTIEECDRLLDMINTMLVISETESGVGQLQVGPMDLGAVVRDAWELFSPIAEDKKVDLVCGATPAITYDGDIRLIQRMIANLLDNAIKYTDSNGHVEIGLTRDSDQTCIITVTDSGVGIPDEQIDQIFKRFFRGDRSRSQQGSGLGLALAQSIARAHGGKIAVSSQIDSGSMFTIELPHRFQDYQKIMLASP